MSNQSSLKKALLISLTALTLLPLTACTPDALNNLGNLVSSLKPSANPTARPESSVPAGIGPVAQSPAPTASPASPADEGDAVKPVPFVEGPKLHMFRPEAIGKRIAAEKARAIAQRFFEETAPNEPVWSSQKAQLGSAAPLTFYDGFESAPSAFEFAVKSATGQSIGHITVHTSAYLDPVPDYSTDGNGHRQGLEDAFRKQHGYLPAKPKFYRFSAFALALEDQDKPENFSTRSISRHFDFLAAKSGKQKLIYFNDTAARIAARWQELESPVSHVMSFSTKSSSGSISGVPSYYQQTLHDGCPVGCVPVAWSMLYGYYDSRYNTVSGSATTQTSSVEDMSETINGYVKTSCGSTSEIWAYLGRKWGKNDRGLTVTTNLDTLWGDNSLFNSAQGEIDDGRPALVGFHDELDSSDPGLEGHAVTAYGYYESSSSKRIYVKTGWSSPTTMTLTVGSGDLDLNWVMKVHVSS